MTGGLMQLVGKGAQDYLVVGNPSFTHFRSVYKRHSDFAMEHFRLYFKTTNITGYVAAEFMDHYNKYKAQASEDQLIYEEDMKKLNKLVQDYRIQSQRFADVSSEYNRVLSLVKKLKATYDASVTENADLDELVKRVLSLLKTKNCVA